MGLLEATANDYEVVKFSWWLAAVALTARPKPVKIALFSPKILVATRKQGLRQSGHWKVFAHFRAWVKLGEEQLSSADSQGLSNVVPWVCSPMSQRSISFYTSAGQRIQALFPGHVFCIGRFVSGVTGLVVQGLCG